MQLLVTSTVSKHRGKDDSMSRGNELKADALVPAYLLGCWLLRSSCIPTSCSCASSFRWKPMDVRGMTRAQ
jgi:hypothetical protein